MTEPEIQKTVYFVRHGESADNVAPVFQSDSALLTKRGHQQAEAVAERLSHLAFSALISSTLIRAEQTTDHIARRCDIEPEFSDLLVERKKPSRVEGKPYTDEQAAALYRAWYETLFTPGARIEDGENYDDTVARADKILDVLEARPESGLVVVTHGYFLRAVLARVLAGAHLNGDIMRQFQASAEMENTGITVLQHANAFEQDYAWRLWTYNDHAHFAE